MSILVTGGTKGIGRAIALRFARPDVDVVVGYSRDRVAAESTLAAIAERGARGHAIAADLSTPEGVAELLAATREHVDQLDQLVHCAVRVLPGPLLAIPPRELSAAVFLNGIALVTLVQEASDLLRRGSTVVFLTSRCGRVVVPNYAAVGGAKALAESLLRYLAVELAPRGVRINAVAPTAIDTEALHAVYGAQTEDVLAQAEAGNPSGRPVRDDDYTALVEFLATPAAEMIQGQVIFVNGGKGLMA